jgi:hypothetical protein
MYIPAAIPEINPVKKRAISIDALAEKDAMDMIQL